MEISSEADYEKLPRREREKAWRRQQIFDAAIHVFAQKGFYDATMDDIADAAELSKGSVYTYFTSKESLLFEIMKQFMHYTILFFKDTLSGQGALYDELIDLLTKTAEYTSHHVELCDLFVSQHALHFKIFSEEYRRILKEYHGEINTLIHKRIQDAIDAGELDRIPPQLVSDIITGALNSIVTFYHHHGTMEKINISVNTFVAVLYNGIGAHGDSAV
jgi:AcrR family transcriptional regulator